MCILFTKISKDFLSHFFDKVQKFFSAAMRNIVDMNVFIYRKNKIDKSSLYEGVVFIMLTIE